MTDCPRDNYFNRQISSSVFGEMPHMQKYSAINIFFFLIAPKHQIPLLQDGLKAGFELLFFFKLQKLWQRVCPPTSQITLFTPVLFPL